VEAKRGQLYSWVGRGIVLVYVDGRRVT